MSHHLQQERLLDTGVTVEPRRMKGKVPSPRPGGKWPQSRLPVLGSGRRTWWVGNEIGTCPSPFPPTDPIAIPTSAGERWRRLSRKREPCGSEVHAVKEARNARARLLRIPRQPTLRDSFQSRPHTNCVYPQERCNVSREEHTAYNVICSHPSALFSQHS